ncbi:MAG: hypothetical protein IPI06_03755 [Gammaproteobacteria bacterium]|nr:hypothetical protein [Gammaproteobacteria bacterium]
MTAVEAVAAAISWPRQYKSAQEYRRMSQEWRGAIPSDDKAALGMNAGIRLKYPLSVAPMMDWTHLSKASY